MSDCRRQAHIDAPIQVVWDLIADVERHEEWWPRVVEIECEELGEGCTYRQVIRTPFGNDEMKLRIEALDEREQFRIRCVDTGTFVNFALTEAQDGTFIDGRMGMDPAGPRQPRCSTPSPGGSTSATGSRSRSTRWARPPSSARRLRRPVPSRTAGRREMGDPGFEPGTSSLSETRSNRLS